MLKTKDKVKATIEKHHLVSEGDVLLLGLSGGPDSIALLNILCELKDELGFTLHAFHVNHMIRGEEADGDEEFAKSECARLAVPFKSVRIDIPKLVNENDDTLEERARKERQKALFCCAKDLGAKVVLAHNKNDQAETVLMRMLRGTGIHGLACMEYERSDGLIRPMLDIQRSEIEQYLLEKGIKARVDSTNLNTMYTRNKVRLEVIPKLLEINPNALDALSRLSLSAREDDEFLNKIALNSVSSIEIAREKDEIRLDAKVLIKFNPSVFARVIKIEFEKIGLNEDIGAVHIDSLRRVIYQNVGNKTVEFPHGYTAKFNHSLLILRKG